MDSSVAKISRDYALDSTAKNTVRKVVLNAYIVDAILTCNTNCSAYITPSVMFDKNKIEEFSIEQAKSKYRYKKVVNAVDETRPLSLQDGWNSFARLPTGCIKGASDHYDILHSCS